MCSDLDGVMGERVRGRCKWERICVYIQLVCELPQRLSVKETICNSGDASSILGSGRSPGRGHDNPLQYSYLKNPMFTLAGYSPWSHKESDTTEATQHRTFAVHFFLVQQKLGFPNGSLVNKLFATSGDAGSSHGLGKSPGRRNGNPLQYSCLENPVDNRASWAIVHRVTKSQTEVTEHKR